MSEKHLRQPGFIYRACGPLNKNKKRIEKIKETGNSRYIYQNELDKACFQHDMAHGDFKDLPRATASDKALGNKAFNIAKSSHYEFLLQWFTNFLIKSLLVVLLHAQINLLLKVSLW